MRKNLLFLFILVLSIGVCNAQILHKNSSVKAEKGLFGKSSGNSKGVKIKEPGSAGKAGKKQAAKERKLKKDYVKSVKRSQKRSYHIQTPEVQTRMKQNQKDTAYRDKTKKRKVKTSNKNAGKKYN